MKLIGQFSIEEAMQNSVIALDYGIDFRIYPGGNPTAATLSLLMNNIDRLTRIYLSNQLATRLRIDLKNLEKQ